MSRLGTVGLSAWVLLFFAALMKGAESGDAATSAEPIRAKNVRPVDVANPIEAQTNAKIRKALDEKTKIDVEKMRLGDVIAQLESLHHIEMRLDAKTLAESSIDIEMPVTFKRQDVSLRSALRSLLRPMDLTYVIRNESLLITTPDVASNELVTIIYPVGDLAAPRRAGQGREDFSQLIDTIASTLAPTTWDEVGGPASIMALTRARSLVVSQTSDVQEQIDELLTALRQARDAQPAPPQPTAMDSLVDEVAAISAAWHRGSNQARGRATGQAMGAGMGGGGGMVGGWVGAAMGGGGIGGGNAGSQPGALPAKNP